MLLLGTDRTQLLRRAFAASLVLHAFVAYVIPVWTRTLSAGDQPVETISFAHIARIRIERPRNRQPVPKIAAPKTAHRDARVRFARVRAELTKNTTARLPRTPAPQAGPRGEIATAPKRMKAIAQAPLVAQAAEQTPDAVSTQPAPESTPVARATAGDRDVASNGTHQTGGVMPFGASMNEPVLDPRVRQQLQSRIKVHVTLIVTVGDNGKTKNVVFDPPLDPSTERVITALLADANWDAAVCGGGIACEGETRIKL